jgi:hypothetical protein
LTFHGTKGSLSTARTGYEITADPKVNPTNAVAKVIPGGHPVGGPQPVPEGPEESWTTPEKDETGDAPKDYRHHARNFLDCIKSRKTPIADLESSHQVAIACHLANISLKIGRKVVWDSAKEQIVNDAEANDMLVRPYRAPWDKELKALLST